MFSGKGSPGHADLGIKHLSGSVPGEQNNTILLKYFRFKSVENNEGHY